MSRRNPWDDPVKRESIMRGIRLAGAKRAAKNAKAKRKKAKP